MTLPPGTRASSIPSPTDQNPSIMPLQDGVVGMELTCTEVVIATSAFLAGFGVNLGEPFG